jgi:hypothetical protein
MVLLNRYRREDHPGKSFYCYWIWSTVYYPVHQLLSNHFKSNHTRVVYIHPLESLRDFKRRRLVFRFSTDRARATLAGV